MGAELERFPRCVVVGEVRRALEEMRAEILAGGPPARRVEERVERRPGGARTAFAAARHQRHRASCCTPTSDARRWAPLGLLPGYSNLEYDLASGRRGKRDVHTAGLLERLIGAPGIAVNNNAAAVFLALNELAAGRRGGRLARRADRDRRRLPHPRHHGSVRRRSARSGHHQPHRASTTIARPSASARACCCACIPAISASRASPRGPALRDLVALGRERGTPGL